jgi:hypothetical protein
MRHAEIVGDHERAGERVEYSPPESYRVLFADGTTGDVAGASLRPVYYLDDPLNPKNPDRPGPRDHASAAFRDPS